MKYISSYFKNFILYQNHENVKLILITLLSFAAFLGVSIQTENPLAGMLLGGCVSLAGGLLFDAKFDPFPALFCVITAINRTACGKPNPGGGRKVWIIPVDQFTADWGYSATGGIVTVSPPVGTSKFVELQVSDNSLKLDQMMKGAIGYQSFDGNFEIKIAGDTPAQTAAVEQLLNTEVVAVILLNDLQRKTVGSTIFPLSFEINHTTGAKGNDPRGWTLKAKNDGMGTPSYFLADTISLPIGVTSSAA